MLLALFLYSHSLNYYIITCTLAISLNNSASLVMFIFLMVVYSYNNYLYKLHLTFITISLFYVLLEANYSLWQSDSWLNSSFTIKEHLRVHTNDVANVESLVNYPMVCIIHDTLVHLTNVDASPSSFYHATSSDSKEFDIYSYSGLFIQALYSECLRYGFTNKISSYCLSAPLMFIMLFLMAISAQASCRYRIYT